MWRSGLACIHVLFLSHPRDHSKPDCCMSGQHRADQSRWRNMDQDDIVVLQKRTIQICLDLRNHAHDHNPSHLGSISCHNVTFRSTVKLLHARKRNRSCQNHTTGHGCRCMDPHQMPELPIVHLLEEQSNQCCLHNLEFDKLPPTVQSKRPPDKLHNPDCCNFAAPSNMQPSHQMANQTCGPQTSKANRHVNSLKRCVQELMASWGAKQNQLAMTTYLRQIIDNQRICARPPVQRKLFLKPKNHQAVLGLTNVTALMTATR